MNLSGRVVGNDTMPDTELNEIIDGLGGLEDDVLTTPPVTQKFGTLGEAGQQFVSDFAERTGGRVGTNAGNTIITVSTGNLLGSSEDVQLAVAEAIKQAQRKGIDVAL